MMQPIGQVIADVLEGLAMDVREQALQSELARERKGSARDWIAVAEQLRRAGGYRAGIGGRQKREERNSCRPTQGGHLRLVLVKG